MPNPDLTQTEMTAEEEAALFKAAYDSVKPNNSQSTTKAFFVDNSTGETKSAEDKEQEPEATEAEGSTETEADSTDKEPDESTEGSEDSASDHTPQADLQEQQPTGAAPKGQAAKRDGEVPSDPAKASKKPSVFDEARRTLDNLQGNDKKAVGHLMSHARNLANENKKLRHKITSDDGRVSGMQRTIDELRNQLAFYQSQPSSSKQSSDKEDKKAATSFSISDIERYIERDPKLKQLSETDPGLAQFLAERELNLEHKTVQKLSQVEEAKHRENKQRYLATQAQIIREAVPNIEEIVNGDFWKQWINTAPAYVKKMADSDHAEEVLDVVYRFLDDLDHWQQENGQAAPNPQVDTSKADKVMEDRNRRAQANTGAPSAVPRPVKKTLPDNDDALFKEAYNSVPKWNQVRR